MDKKLQAQQEQVRIPLYSTEEQRNTYKNSDWTIKDQVLVNCFPLLTKDPLADDGGKLKIQSRPGLESPELSVSLTGVLTNLTAAEPKAVLAMTQLEDVIVIAYADGANWSIVQYRPVANTCLLIGTITGSTTYDVSVDNIYLSEIEVGGVPYVAITVSKRGLGGASAAYYAASTNGVFTAYSQGAIPQITDTDFPPNAYYNRKIVGPIVQLNNVHYVMTEIGIIHGSYPALTAGAPSQITVWDTNGFIGAIQSPDRGVGLIRYKHHLVALGEETMEFFSDEGIAQPALPIRRTDQAFIKIGVQNAKAIINVDDVLYFLGKSSTSNVAMYKLEGYTPVQLSQPSQSLTVSNRARYKANFQAISLYGTKHIITNVNVAPGLTWKGQNTPDNTYLEGSLVYCIDSNSWWVWAAEHNLYGFAFSGYNETILVANNSTGSWGNTRYVWGIAFNQSPNPYEEYGLHPRALSSGDEQADNAYFDCYRVTNTANLDYYRIPIAIITNSLDFETLNRKFIRRIKVAGELIGTALSGGVFDTFNGEGYYLNLAVWKDDEPALADTPNTVRSLDLLQVDTSGGKVDLNNYSFYNFGSSRTWKFGIFISAYSPIRLEALEVTVAQGTH